MPVTATDIVNFLTTNTHIAKLNFGFLGLKVYPTAYQKDVAGAITTSEIIVRTKGSGSAAAGAAYDMNYDSFELTPAFNIANVSDQAFLIHECTHAHLDIQEMGKHSGHENEAVAYVAEALFLEAQGAAPLSGHTIRTLSHRVATALLKPGGYMVPPADAAAIVAEVAKHPHYASKVSYNSNGFKRGWHHNALR